MRVPGQEVRAKIYVAELGFWGLGKTYPAGNPFRARLPTPLRPLVQGERLRGCNVRFWILGLGGVMFKDSASGVGAFWTDPRRGLPDRSGQIDSQGLTYLARGRGRCPRGSRASPSPAPPSQVMSLNVYQSRPRSSAVSVNLRSPKSIFSCQTVSQVFLARGRGSHPRGSRGRSRHKARGRCLL